jgi:WD40 repeat protein
MSVFEVCEGRVFSAGDDTNIIEWDVKGNKIRSSIKIDTSVSCLSSSFDGTLFSGSAIGSVRSHKSLQTNTAGIFILLVVRSILY